MQRALLLAIAVIFHLIAASVLATDLDTTGYSPKMVEAVVNATAIARGRPGMDMQAEHLLLALIRLGDEDTLSALRDAGIPVDSLTTALEARLPPPVATAQIGEAKPQTSPELLALMGRAAAHRPSTPNGGPLTTSHFLLSLAEDAKMGPVLTSAGGDLGRLSAATRRTQLQTEPAGTVKEADVLASLSTDLTELARRNEIDPAFHRDAEIDDVIDTLLRGRKNNALLVGEPGVGKTAIVEGLAHRIISGDVPPELRGKRIVSLDLAALVGNTKYRGEFEEKVRKVLQSVINDPNVILFIDEAHGIMGAGGNSAEGGGQSLADIMKPMMARGNAMTIGATTLDEYKKTIELDGAAERRWKIIKVGAPTTDGAVAMLRKIKLKYENAHGVTISDQAVLQAVQLAKRFLPHRNLPDSAIEVLDDAAVFVKREQSDVPYLLRKMHRDIEDAEARLVTVTLQGVAGRQRREALEQALETLKQEARTLHAAWQRGLQLIDILERNSVGADADQHREELAQIRRDYHILPAQVGPDEVSRIVSRTTGIPILKLSDDAHAAGLHAEENLGKHVIGQHEAIGHVARALRRSKAGVSDPNHPIGVVLFLGPRGTGKSSLAQAIATEEFGSPEALIALGMSSFMEKHTAARLIGAPPGYVGYEEGGQLTEAVRRRPYAVVLLDEIEKAHRDIHPQLLEILETGQIKDSKGRVIDFRNTIVVMTSNIGVAIIEKGGDPAAVDAALREELLRWFSPEFLDRFDAVAKFTPHTDEDLVQIGRLKLNALADRLRDRGIEIVVTDSAAHATGMQAASSGGSGRDVRRAMQEGVEDPLADLILTRKVVPGGSVVIDHHDGAFAIDCAGALAASNGP